MMHAQVFVHIIQRIIIPLLYPWHVIIMPMYNAHPCFSFKNLGKKFALHTVKCGKQVEQQINIFLFLILSLLPSSLSLSSQF